MEKLFKVSGRTYLENEKLFRQRNYQLVICSRSDYDRKKLLPRQSIETLFCSDNTYNNGICIFGHFGSQRGVLRFINNKLKEIFRSPKRY